MSWIILNVFNNIYSGYCKTGWQSFNYYRRQAKQVDHLIWDKLCLCASASKSAVTRNELKKTSYIAAVYRWILIVGYCLHWDSLYVEISLGEDSVNIFNLCTLVAQIRSLVAYPIPWPSSLIISLQRRLFASPEQYDGQDERALRPYSHTFFMLVFRELLRTCCGQKQLFVALLLFSL